MPGNHFSFHIERLAPVYRGPMLAKWLFCAAILAVFPAYGAPRVVDAHVHYNSDPAFS